MAMLCPGAEVSIQMDHGRVRQLSMQLAQPAPFETITLDDDGGPITIPMQ
jgi:hypothetical protein